MRRLYVGPLLLGAALVSCRREPVASIAAPQDAAIAGSATDAPSSARPVVVAARCHPTDRALQLDDGDALDELEIGDGVAHAGQYAIGLIHRSLAGRVAAVARMDEAAAGVRLVDLAPALGDAPPPRLASCRDQLVAAVFVRPSYAPAPVHAATYVPRDLALYLVGALGPEPAVIHVPQRSDESLALDLACSGASGLAVWDETAVGLGPETATQHMAVRGVVRGASFQVGQRAAVINDLSPPESDAEMPRAVPNGEGFLVFWLARRPEVSRASDGSADIEAVGEARTFGWLEAVAIDAAGKVTGPVRRLTSILGPRLRVRRPGSCARSSARGPRRGSRRRRVGRGAGWSARPGADAKRRSGLSIHLVHRRARSGCPRLRGSASSVAFVGGPERGSQTLAARRRRRDRGSSERRASA